MERGVKHHAPGVTAPAAGGAKERELESLVQELRRQNAELQHRNATLQDESRALKYEQLRRDEMTAVKGRPSTASARSATRRRPTSAVGSRRDDQSFRAPLSAREAGVAAGSARHIEMLHALRARLDGAEEAMRSLEDENRALREQLEVQQARRGGAVVATDQQLGTVQRQLTEATAQLTLVKARGRHRSARAPAPPALTRRPQTRYDHLSRRAEQEREVQERTLQELEEYNRQTRDLRRRVQVAEQEKAAMEVFKASVSSCAPVSHLEV